MPQLQGIINRFCMSFAQKVGVIAWCSEPSAVEVKADYLRGRFADVYRAEHNGRSVAIKALRWYENIPKSDIVKVRRAVAASLYIALMGLPEFYSRSRYHGSAGRPS